MQMQTTDRWSEHPVLRLFAELLAAPAPSGYEQAIGALIRQRLIQMGYQPATDGAGNISVRLAGQRAADAPLLCLAAHMDEIGFVVTRIEPDGVLLVERSGGLYPWKLGEGPVEVLGDEGSVTGILSMGSTHTARTNQAVEWSNVRVLTGLSATQLAERGIRPGSAGVPRREVCGPYLLGDDDPLVAAWTFDDRMGVVALLRLLEELQQNGQTPVRPLLVAFTTGEEVGGLGAKVLAQREQPETFIAVDGCPMPPGSPLVLDARPGIWVKDRLAPYDQQLVRDLSQAARAAGTELQPVAYEQAASDASLVYAAGSVQRIACFGHVRENSHGYEVARLAVFDNVLTTLVQFVTTWE
jgi:putative aminopeptidase FrvX